MALIAIAVTAWSGAEASEPVFETDPGFAGYWVDEEVKPVLDSVMADDAFREYEVEARWVSKRREAEEPQNREEADALAALFQRLGLVLSLLAEFALWILLALLLWWLYVKRDAWLPYLSRPPGSAGPSPRVELTSGTIAAVDLPPDIPGRVRQLWADGRHREALSLLYRGSVFALVDRYGVRLPASATEGDCIAAVSEQARGSQAELFRRIVVAWMQLAYGAERPADATIDELTSSWPQHYGGSDA